MEEEKEELPKRIVFIEKNEEGPIIVRNFDDMLHLLDEGREIKEEISGDIFIMTKKTLKPEDPSKNLKRPLSPT